MEYRTEGFPSNKHIELDFEEVEVGVTKVKSIKILNQSRNTQSYVVQKDPLSNPLDCVFHTIECSSWSLSPSESYLYDISFRPILPNRKYTDNFFIVDTHNCCYKIVVSGYSKGPKITSSNTRLVMVCDSNRCVARKSIKLTNHTNVPAAFVFDNDAVQCPFKISEVSGVIKACSSKCLTISFEPSGIGIYKYYLPCLILHQSPVILELYGVCGCTSDKTYIQEFHSRIECIEELDDANSFKTYLSDVTTAVKSDPPTISMSCSFLDFGHAEVGAENVGKRTSQTVCLTNHNRFNVFVIWEKDKRKIFSIRPREARVRANQSIIFEVRFDPVKERNFYSCELLARVFQLSCCSPNIEISNEILMTVFPEFVSIRLIGHTYSRNVTNWRAQYEIPETVTMPASIPAMPTYTTIVIKNFGPQPLMFSFIPPAVSHYDIKPMMGVISRYCEALRKCFYDLIS